MLSASTQEIAHLRAQANAGPASRIERACARCKLARLFGDPAEVTRILSEAIEKLRHDLDAYEKAHLLANSAILVGEMELAAGIIREYIQPGLSLILTIDEAPVHRSASVRWTVTEANRSQFAFNSHMLTSLGGEVPIGRWLSTVPLFAHFMDSPEISPGMVNVGLEDRGTVDGLAYCDDRPDIFLIPDPVFFRTLAYQETRESFAQNHTPWEQRRPIAFWRGGTTGRPERKELGWRGLPRVQLCEISRQHPELLDAELTDIVQIRDEEIKQEIASSGLMARRRPIKDILRYRYQIDIDGNSNSWPGLFQKLLSGSTVLKVSSPSGYQQWYYDRLKPWIHLVPVESDLSDLIEKLEWLRANDSHAQAIGQRGRILACSMTLAGELDRSVRTLRAAFRASMKLPEQSIFFGAGASGNAHLGYGWDIGDDSAWTVGRASLIEIPMPARRGDYTIEFDLSPSNGAEILSAIAVNGQSRTPYTIDRRQTIRQFISICDRRLDERLSILLLNPCARPAASAARPLDERLIGVRLHAIHVRKCVSPRGHPSSLRRPHGVIPAREDSVQTAIMRSLHREDIWRGFHPSGPWQNVIQGWNGIYPAFKQFLSEAPNKIFIDVGVWKGQSSIFVAEWMRDSAIDGCVIAVDTFLGSLEHFHEKSELFELLHGRPNLYETFLDNVYYSGLSHLVVPLPQTSVTAAALLQARGIQAGMVHIDASHAYADTLRDAELYWPLVVSGGYLIGDDYHETWPGVVRAAREFASRRGLELLIRMPKWILRKP